MTVLPARTKLADVPPNHRGMPFRAWRNADLDKQSAAHKRAITTKPEDAPLAKKAIWTPRDSYGMKSI